MTVVPCGCCGRPVKGVPVYPKRKSVKYFLFLLLLLPSVTAFREDYNTASGRFWVSCRSDSMRPAFSCHDNLSLDSHFDRYNLSVGSVVWFRPRPSINASFVIHRIVEVNSSPEWYCNKRHRCYFRSSFFYVTKGDANQMSDLVWNGPVLPEDIKFRVSAINGVAT